jgi:hypothetical protein
LILSKEKQFINHSGFNVGIYLNTHSGREILLLKKISPFPACRQARGEMDISPVKFIPSTPGRYFIRGLKIPHPVI